MTVYTACQQTYSLSLSFCISSSFHISLTQTQTHKSVSVSEAQERLCAYVGTHPQRSNDGHWLESVCYSYIMFLYITVTRPITIIIIITIITIWKAGGTWESENKGALRGEKSQERETEK